jgi:hypothetical protein
MPAGYSPNGEKVVANLAQLYTSVELVAYYMGPGRLVPPPHAA